MSALFHIFTYAFCLVFCFADVAVAVLNCFLFLILFYPFCQQRTRPFPIMALREKESHAPCYIPDGLKPFGEFIEQLGVGIIPSTFTVLRQVSVLNLEKRQTICQYLCTPKY